MGSSTESTALVRFKVDGEWAEVPVTDVSLTIERRVEAYGSVDPSAVGIGAQEYEFSISIDNQRHE